VRDLADGGYLSVQRNGRRNSYSVNPDAPFRHPTLSHVTLGKFVEMISSPLPVALLAGVSFQSAVVPI
jgi:hypothetical protein